MSIKSRFLSLAFVATAAYALLASASPNAESAASADGSRRCSETHEGKCLIAACATDRPTLVVFSRPGCPACRRLQNETLDDPRVQRRLQSFNYVYVNTEDNQRIADSYGIDGVPTLIGLGNDCRKRAEPLVGFRNVETVLQYLDATENL